MVFLCKSSGGLRQVVNTDQVAPACISRVGRVSVTHTLSGAVTANCLTTYQLIQVAAKARGAEISLERIEGMVAIVGFGAMSTPGGVSDRKKVRAGSNHQVGGALSSGGGERNSGFGATSAPNFCRSFLHCHHRIVMEFF